MYFKMARTYKNSNHLLDEQKNNSSEINFATFSVQTERLFLLIFHQHANENYFVQLF